MHTLPTVRQRLLWLTGLLVACGGGDGLRVLPGEVGQAGGVSLRVEGDDFAGHGPAAVYIGTHGAKAIVIESRWLITAISPPTEALGPVDVQVTFTDGTTMTAADALTIVEDAGPVLRPSVGG